MNLGAGSRRRDVQIVEPNTASLSLRRRDLAWKKGEIALEKLLRPPNGQPREPAGLENDLEGRGVRGLLVLPMKSL